MVRRMGLTKVSDISVAPYSDGRHGAGGDYVECEHPRLVSP